MSKYFYFLLISLFVCNACNVADVSSDYDRNVDFNQYKSYNYFTNIDWGEMNELDQQRILNALDHELMSKGLTKTETPDLLIDIKAQSKIVKKNAGSIGVGSGNYGRHTSVGVSVGIPISTKRIRNNYIIEMVDNKNDHLVWQGIFEKDVSPNADNDEMIVKAIEKLIKKYPPEK